MQGEPHRAFGHAEAPRHLARARAFHRDRRHDVALASLQFGDNTLGKELSDKELMLQQLTREVYDERLAKGIAREQARKDLPLSTYTEAYWKVDLHNLLHFLALRMDAHAQYEI